MSENDHLTETELKHPALLVLFVFLLGFAAIPFDLMLSDFLFRHDHQFVRQYVRGDLYRTFEKLVTFSETFAHPVGIVLILWGVACLDRLKRYLIPLLVICSIGSGLMANLFKLLIVSRTRPRAFDWSGSVFDTFQQWFPILKSSWNELFISDIQSFPSSHTATAFGFAFVLSWVYPKGKYLFFSLAILAAGQRITTGAHFLSDTCFGACVGLLFAYANISKFESKQIASASKLKTISASKQLAA